MKRCWYILITIFFWIFSIWNVYALEKIAIIDISNVFHQSSQRMEVIKQLENEFKDRAVELQSMEHELQMKMQTLQRDGSTMKVDERNALEQSVIDQREIFSNKAKIFQQDNQNRQTEERDKILNIIHNIVNSIAKKEGYDLVIDSSAIVYNTKNIKDITQNVMNQVK